MNKMPLFVSVIVPCYNEEEGLATAYQRLTEVMAGDWHDGYELIFINDGSKDHTLDILTALAADDPNCKVIGLSRNFGHQAAVASGIKYCTGDIAIIIDADLQDPPELFPEMVDIYRNEGCNVVNGIRRTRKGETYFKKTSAKLFYRLLNRLSDVELTVDSGDFRLIDRKVIDTFNNFREKNKYIRGIISWMGFKQSNLYYDRDPRVHGETKYSFRKMMSLAVRATLYFSKKPLKLALTLGSFSIVIGLILAAFAVYITFSSPDETVPGWTSTIITIVFFGGVQLFTMGVAGEYIGNILDEVKNRPEYIIDQKINFKKEED